MRDLLPSSDSLDYANRWRSPHAEPPSHSDRKSCSTRREISSPVYSHPFIERIGHNIPHGHRNRLCDHNSESALRDGRHGVGFAEFCSGVKIPPGGSWIWVPEHRRYSHPLRFIPTPSSKELGITFRTGIGIAYVTTIRNRHSETVDMALVSRNSVLEQKFPRSVCTSTPTAVTLRSDADIYSPGVATPSITRIAGGAHTRSRPATAIGSRVQLDVRSPPQSVCISTPIAVPSGRTRIFIRPGVGTAREAPIQNRHFDPIGKRTHSEISRPVPKFLSGSAVAGCRCDRIRTPLRSNRHNFSLGYRNRL
ncbi:hypothetical protein Taro_055694 [Colocasia esculenta]|uniref:Uncharacterized protein n=1 Tax=Colocasia esculenta TaxID=4460 RepID=A0A843XUE5_COLES|nr:hypothetical protein [Colocasia esculenta]